MYNWMHNLFCRKTKPLTGGRSSNPPPLALRLRLERLEDRLAPAVVSDGGTTTLSLALDANEQLAIVSQGTSYTFTSSNSTFTTISATDPANQATAFSGFTTNTLTLTAAGIAQYSTINVTDAAAGASVVFDDSGINAYNASFSVQLTDPAAGDITFNGNSNFGAHALLASTTQNITVNSGANITTTSGTITLMANQQATATSGNFDGIDVFVGTITSATGSILLEGKGGDTGNDDYGIFVGGIVSSTGTGAGAATITLDGSSSGGTTACIGIGLNGMNTAVTSVDGAIQLTGTAELGTSTFNDGIFVQNAAQVSSTGTATVTLDGTGAGSGGLGINLLLGGTVSSTGTGNITLTADSMSIDTTSAINAGTNTVTLQPQTAVTVIDLGGANAAGTLGLSNAELGRVTAGTLKIGSAANTGGISITAAITATTGWSTLSLLTGGGRRRGRQYRHHYGNDVGAYRRPRASARVPTRSKPR